LHERHGDVKRGRETHRHDYTQPPAALSDELGGLSTWLGLCTSPPLILSTESVVVMQWKGMSTSTAASAEVLPGEPVRVAVDVLMPFLCMTTTDSVESIRGGLVKSPSDVLNPPSSSLKAAGGCV